MGFTDVVKIVTELIAEVNKAEDNTQQKKFLSTLRSIERQIKKQEKTAKKHLVIGVIVSSIGSAFVGLVLGKFFLN